MSNGGESDGDGGIHVSTRDVTDGIDHHRNNEATRHWGSELRHPPWIICIDRPRAAGHEHQQKRRYRLRQHLPIKL